MTMNKKLVVVTASIVPLLSILWAFQLPLYLGVEVARSQLLSALLGLAVALVFLKDQDDSGFWQRSIDGVLALTAIAVFGWMTLEHQRFLLDFPYLTLEMQFLSGVSIMLALEAIRRTTGWILLSVISVFLIYALWGDAVPAPLTGTSATLQETSVYLAFDPSSMLGTPLSVVASIVIVFIFFGKLLVKAGCGEFFIDLAMASMGRSRGGAAKTSIIGSALFGSISGSAVSNVVTTGVMTIPLMKRSGYSSVQAGAIESVASTGGQLMPPIMGAAAFLMAQSLEIPYSAVVISALIPALLYYISVFIQVDLIAARDNIAPHHDGFRSFSTVLVEGGHFLLPFIVLLYAMFAHNVSAELAALYSSISLLSTSFVRSYQGYRLSLRGFLSALPDTGMAVVELVMIVAGAGLVIGLLNLSSGGFALTVALVQMGTASMGLLLLIAAGVCILLGMGMPTTGVYVLLAALVAPALIDMGIEPLAAHMFILYFGMMSMITPPIALAAFAASTVTGAKPMSTGAEAMRLGWAAYVVPLLFIFSPPLLMDGDFIDIAKVCLITVAAVHFISVAIVGYYSRKLKVWARGALLVIGVVAILPESIMPLESMFSVVAVAAGVLFLRLITMQTKRELNKLNAT